MKGKEVLPDPGSMFQSIRYIQDQAARGSFRGRTAAYLVLTYLVTNMWVKVGNPDEAGLGEVMYGRSSIATIAACTTLSRRGVQYALTWLSDNGWIDTQRSRDDTGREDRRYILVRLDMSAHRERDRLRQAEIAIEEILGEGATSAQREGATSAQREGATSAPS